MTIYKKMKIIFVAAAFFMFSARVLSAAGGTTSATFLKLGVGARPVAMGSAFTGIADDVNAVSWNPAGLVNIEGKEFSFMHLEHFQNIKYESVCYGVPLSVNSALAFGGGYLYTDDIAKTFINEDVYAGFVRDGSYRLEDKTFFVAYSRMFAEDKAAGLLIRWLSERIEDYEASGVSLDAGYLMLLSQNFSFGFSVQNLGGTIRFIAAEEKLPLTLRAGFGYNPYPSDGRLRFGVDVSKSSDYQPSVNVGVEYKIIKSVLDIRGGWRFKDLFSDDRLDDISGLSCGIGFSFYRYTLDYAFVPYGALGYSHRISLTGRF